MAAGKFVTTSFTRLSYITQVSFSWVFPVKMGYEWLPIGDEVAEERRQLCRGSHMSLLLC